VSIARGADRAHAAVNIAYGRAIKYTYVDEITH
jgi:hypothetical protein